ncbi:MAG: QcrA and Rieske domain-containing protein [Nitrososphaerales archaeon]
MSESQEDAEKKKSAQKKAEQTGTQDATSQPTPKLTAPRVGTPIGQSPSPRPQVGTPIGTQPASTSATTAPARSAVGTPVGTPRPTVGTPVSAPKPSTPVGTIAAKPTVSAPASPAVASVSKPAAPAKPPESKAEISRRNFIKGLAVLGGIVAVGQFVALGPYLQSSVGTSNITNQVIQNSATGDSATLTTGETLKTTTAVVSSPNSWTTFVYPRTGNPNIDNDTFRQCVLIHLPKGWTAGQYGTVDPISGDTFVALSRVCVHLWCLWSYVPTDDRGICPCHGSQYIPGGPAGTKDATEPGLAVAGPASLQTAPNNQLPVITLSIASDGTISATGVVGQIGCGQKC